MHEIAEQLEHVHSDRLIEQLDEFWGSQNLTLMVILYRMPAASFTLRNQVLLSSLEVGDDAQVVAVREHDADFYNICIRGSSISTQK